MAWIPRSGALPLRLTEGGRTEERGALRMALECRGECLQGGRALLRLRLVDVAVRAVYALN